MNWTFLSVLTVGLLCAAPAFGEDTRTKEIEKALATLNAAFELGDLDKIKSLMTADHISVTSYYGGPVNRSEQLKNTLDLKLTEYKVEKMQTTLLDKDTALVTYELTQKGTFKGKTIGTVVDAPVSADKKGGKATTVPVTSFASAIWVQRDGKWMERFYQETDLNEK